MKFAEDNPEEGNEKESKIIFLDSASGGADDLKIRKCMLYGDINEQSAKEQRASVVLGAIVA
jgi:hypothetical protein